MAWWPSTCPARLAFRSACQTAVGAVDALDESVHIAAALPLGGTY